MVKKWTVEEEEEKQIKSISGEIGEEFALEERAAEKEEGSEN